MKKLLKSLSLLLLITLIAGCTPKGGLDVAQKPKIDENLPVLDNTKIRMIPGIKSMALEWVGTDEENTNGYHIYRSQIQKDGEKLTRVASLKDKYARHWLDDNLDPQTEYIYSISVIGKNGLESRASQSIPVRTLPILDSVSFVAAQDTLPRKVRIVWRPHDNHAVASYIIEKNTPSQSKWEKVATVKHRLNAEFIDNDLKDKEVYSYRVRAVTFDGIVSNPSKVVKATTKPLPNPPMNIEATTNEPRKIILRWDQAEQEDKTAYKVYVSGSAEGFFDELQTTKRDDNTFIHMINGDNEVRYYKVTTIDKDELESDVKLQPVVMGRTLPAPSQPMITLAQINTNKVILNWSKGDDRAISYNIYKTIKRGFFESETKVIKDVKDLRFEDEDITRGVEYQYAIQAVDEHNLVSEKTSSTSLSMPKLQDKKDN
jgi:fibronectin type 3 domain-containing protein/predicted small lipoprotein YifL